MQRNGQMNDSAHMGQPSVDTALPFFYVMVVWGESYVDMFLDIALPTFMSPGNLPALSNLKESRFLILTTPADRVRIEAAPIFKKLCMVIEPVFVDSPWMGQNIPYHLKAARGHRAAAEIAAQGDGYCVYLCPDCLISDGSFRHLEQMARAGKQAVMTPGLRLIQESVYEELKQTGKLDGDGPLTFSGRELVEFGMRHLHLEVQRYNWEHPQFTVHPHMCTWNVPGDTGLLIRAFHLHPMLVSMRGAKDFPSLEVSTIDGDFLGYSVTDWEQIHVETDSDNLLIFSLTGRDERFAALTPNAPNIANIQGMAYSPLVNPLHRLFFTRAIKLHSGELGSSWSAVEKKTAPLVYPILQLDLADKVHLRRVPWRNLVSELKNRVPQRAARMIQELRPLHNRRGR